MVGSLSSLDSNTSRLKHTDGYCLHSDVPMDRWCVTRDDLRELRIAVQEHIRKGDISPTVTDPFDLSDNVYGPSIYTVVEQFIKPITKMAGGQSWALMRHPDGLQCDLFITHSWVEGIFEFIDKVLNSWPRGARHAYCCMLSNPQNLNIGDLLSSPTDSPFAKALMSATFVLVVPNRKTSIYTRVCCVYEAFLAYNSNKTILVASFPIQWFSLQLAVPLFFAVLSVAIYVQFPLASLDVEQSGYKDAYLRINVLRMTLEVAVWAGALLIKPGRRLRIFNYIGCAAFGVLIGTAFQNFSVSRYGSLNIYSSIIDIFFCVACEADRMWMAENAKERHILQKRYTGHVSDARSSAEEDKTQILSEILRDGQESEVDLTIEVLVMSGMSTDALRQAFARGVQIDSAGHYRLSFLVFGVGLWFGTGYGHLYYRWGEHSLIFKALAILNTMEAVSFLYIFSTRGSERAFIGNIALKFLLPARVLELCCYVLKCLEVLTDLSSALLLVCVALRSPGLLFAAIGLGRLVEIPLIGAPLARFIAGARRQHPPPSDTILEDALELQAL